MPRMAMSALLRIEKILDIWNILIMVNGGIVTNVGSLQTKSVRSRHLTNLYDEHQFLTLFTSNFFRI
jgi:hypothetical protein